MQPPDVIAYWQRTLRLQDWDIDVEEVPSDTIGGACGQCSTWAALGRARIRLARMDTLTPEKQPIHSDQEETLVHEMLHILIPADRKTGRASPRQERAVEAIAQALIRLNRGERR